MSRRAQQTELGFGSDSFLDIIANIVGILIILIVIAGLRVSRAPLSPPEDSETPPPTALAETPQEPDRSEMRDERSELKDNIPDSSSFIPHPSSSAPSEPSPELLRQVTNLNRELNRLKQDQQQRLKQFRAAVALEEKVLGRFDTLEQTLQQEAERLQEEKKAVTVLRGTVEEEQTELASLTRQLDREEDAKPPVKRIEHKLTPVSREVDGAEVHFRLKNGRVSRVPIDELIERLRDQLKRKQQSILKYRRVLGEVGPVRGYRMKYVMERRRLSTLEQFQFGGVGAGLVRIVLSEWEIREEPDLETESADQALQPASDYIRALRVADPDAAVTFWVYPDSFGEFRALQTFAHSQGFHVAARPLPFGVSIAGSPDGTRSAAQ